MAPKKRTAQAAAVQDEGAKRKQQRGGAREAPAKKENGKDKSKGRGKEATVETPALEKVIQALLRAQDLSSRSRCKLVSGLPGCFGAAETNTERSPEQRELLQTAWKSLQGVEAKLLGKLNSSKAKENEAAKQLAASEEAKREAQEAANESAAALKIAKEGVLQCNEAVEAAQQRVTSAEADLRAGDCEIGSKAMEREQLLAAGHGQDPAYSDSLAQLGQAISRAALARAERIALADRARAVVLEAGEAQQRSSQAVEEAAQRQQHCEAEVKRVAKASKTHNPTAARAKKAVDQNTQNLADFRSGPLAALRELGGFEMEAQEENAGDLNQQQDTKRPADQIEEPQIRVVKRRRCSWLPRHQLAALVGEVVEDGKRKSILQSKDLPAACTDSTPVTEEARSGGRDKAANLEEVPAYLHTRQGMEASTQPGQEAGQTHGEQAAPAELACEQPMEEVQEPVPVQLPAVELPTDGKAEEVEPAVAEQQHAMEEEAEEKVEPQAAEEELVEELVDERVLREEVQLAAVEQQPTLEDAEVEVRLPAVDQQPHAEEAAVEEKVVVEEAQLSTAEQLAVEEAVEAEVDEEAHLPAVEQQPTVEEAAVEEAQLRAEEQQSNATLEEAAEEEAQPLPEDEPFTAAESKADDMIEEVEQQAEVEKPSFASPAEEATVAASAQQEETPAEKGQEATDDVALRMSPSRSPRGWSPDGLKAAHRETTDLSEVELKSLPTPGRRASLA